MFDRLEDLLIRFEEIMGELGEPTVTNNQERFRALMKEQSNLTPIVNAYREYKKCNQDIEDSLSMLESESDEEMREMLKEELSEAKKRVEALEKELKILLPELPEEMSWQLAVDTWKPEIPEPVCLKEQSFTIRPRTLMVWKGVK